MKPYSDPATHVSEHMTGFVDSSLKLMPPVFASADYIAGYREGFRNRLYEAQRAIEEIKHNETLSVL